MDCGKVGRLIYKLRKGKKLTQKQLADELGISDKTVSKWERGMGCPDLSLWSGLSEVLGADVKKMLDDEVFPSPPDNGNIKKINFYVCPTCGNVLTGTSRASITCCGMNLPPLVPKNLNSVSHNLKIQPMDGEYYVSLEHEMTKEHYVVFVAYVYNDKVYVQRLYPQQDASFRLPSIGKRGYLYAYCNKHGFWQQKLV